MVDITNNIPTALGLADTVGPADTISPASAGRQVAKELRSARSAARAAGKSIAAEASSVAAPAKAKWSSYIPGAGTLLGITGAIGFIELPFIGLSKAFSFIGTKTKWVGLERAGKRLGDAVDATGKPTLHSTFGISDRGIIKNVADKTSRVVEHSGVDKLKEKFSNPHRHQRRAEVRLNNARTSAKGIVVTGHTELDRELKGIQEVTDKIASPEKAEPSLEAIGNASERIEKLVKNDKGAKKAYKAVRKNVDTTISEIERAAIHHGKFTGSRTLSKSIKELPEAISKIKTKDAIMHLSWIGMTGLEFKGHWDDFKRTLQNEKQAYADHENRDVKDISTRRFLFATLPAPLATDRMRAFKILGVSALSSLASTGIMLWQLVRSGKVQRGGSMASSLAMDMLAFQGPQWGADAITAYVGDPTANTYASLREMYKAGKEVPVDGYKTLLMSGVPELRERKNGAAIARALAKQYKGVDPKQVQDEIFNGTVVKERIPAILAANEAAKAKAKAAKAQQDAPQAGHEAHTSHSHEAALSNDKNHRTIEHDAHTKHSHVSALTEKNHRHAAGEHTKRVAKDSDLPVERGV